MKATPAPSNEVRFDTPEAGELMQDPQWLALYNESFPKDQREQPATIAKTIRLAKGLVLRARIAGETVGLASAHLLESSPAVFLVYLAVTPAKRNLRIGSQLFEQTWREGASRLRRRGMAPHGCVWEVEHPDLVPDGAERSLACKRLEFFERLGGSVLHQQYHQPPINGPRPVPMMLMGRPDAGHKLPAAVQIVRAMYFEKYGAMNGIPDEILARLLRDTMGAT